MKDIITVKNLTKSFGEVKAVSDLSFGVKECGFFALLGENGAGKSTTISMICGLLEADGGSVTVSGIDVANGIGEACRYMGIVFQNSVLDKALSAYENLKSRAVLYGITGKAADERINELAKLLEFEDLLGRTFGKLSGGQRRRIDIARALLHKPKILILDEPTMGLDPQTRKTVWNVIHYLQKEYSMTVMLTTHYLAETEQADEVVIIDKGKIVAQGKPHELKNRYTHDRILFYNVSEAQVAALGLKYEKEGEGFRVDVANTAEAAALIIKNPDLFKDFEILKGTMDDVFLAVTGKRIVEKSE